MESLRSGFARFRHVTLRVPKELRKEMRRALGKVHKGEALATEVKRFQTVVSVGDFCTRELLRRGIRPRICVVDYRTKRRNSDTYEDLRTYGERVLSVKNPAGVLRADLWSVLHEAFKCKERVRVEVKGEEDLASLACIALAPNGSAIVYGLPGRGAVVVRVQREVKELVLDMLSRMEKEYGNRDTKHNGKRAASAHRVEVHRRSP